MGRSQKWPDLRSPISKIRDRRFVGTDHLIIFQKFHNFPWNIVAVTRLESYFVVGSLDLTWWPDLTWHWVEIFTKVAEKMGDKVGENPAALRAAVFLLSSKNLRRGGRSNAPPPARRGLRHLWWPRCKCWSVTPLKIVWGHPRSPRVFADSLRLRRARDIIVVSMLLSWQYASSQKQHDLLGSPRDLDLRSCRGQMYLFRCVLTRETRCRPNYISIALGSNVISEKPYSPKTSLTFHGLWRLTYWSYVISDEKALPERFMSCPFYILRSDYSSRDNDWHSW